VGVSLHAPPLAPAVLHDPEVSLRRLHQPRQQHPVVDVQPAVGQDALPVEEEVHVDGDRYRYGSLLHHIRQTLAVVCPQTSIGVVSYLEFSPLELAGPLEPLLHRLVAEGVSQLSCHSPQHHVGESAGHPSAVASLIPESE
jgi:hypothetical protein